MSCRLHGLRARGGREPDWQLFDLAVDYGQKNNVAARHPEVVRELSAAFDRWWAGCLPLMVNENVVGPKLNPFAVWYWEQFGGGPDAEDLRIMEPSQTQIPRARAQPARPIR